MKNHFQNLRLNGLKREYMARRTAQLVGLGMFFSAAAAQAAFDTTPILAGIADAGTAILAILGALTALSVSIFGLAKVYKFVSSKAGA